jgi:hypothetical protein
MTGHLRRNAVAYLALFVALGGTSWAAVTLPRNSVGSAQLKRGAVKSPDVGRGAVTSRAIRNRTIQRQDLAANVLTTGPAGPVGAAGPAGAPGAPGPTGPSGAPGPTEGQSVDGSSATAGNLHRDPATVTTSRAGRLLVSKSVTSMSASCGGGTTPVFFLELDRKRIRGTTFSTSVTINAPTFVGVTSDVVPAGTHTVEIGIDCEGGTASVTGHGNATVVVLG